MELNVIIEAHAYADEQLCDCYFEEESHYGIVGAEIMAPLATVRGRQYKINYDDNTNIRELIAEIRRIIWKDDCFDPFSPIRYSFLSKSERMYVVDWNKKLKSLIDYFDPDNTGIITICILVSHNAGDVGGIFPLRFFVRSREAGKHHEPHIHVEHVDHEHSATVRISDGEVIEGNLKPRHAKLAKEKILSDQDYYYSCWNKLTDGIAVDINHHNGFIGY